MADRLSLAAGLLALLAAGLYLLDDSGTADLDRAVVAAGSVVLVGCAFVVGEVVRVLRRGRRARG